MDSKNLKTIALSVVTLLIIGIGLYFGRSVYMTPQQRPIKSIYNFNPEECPGKGINFEINDVYMRGIFDEKQNVKISLNWYKCNPPMNNDMVLYRFSLHEDPVVRRIVGKPGDTFKVVEASKEKGWNLMVNGLPVKAIKGEYFFGGELPPPLSLAEGARQGKLGPNEVIVFSAFPPGEKDSGVFGAIALKDIIGKVLIPPSDK